MKARHAYLIMAHHQFELLKLLLSSLDDERNDIYLHIDSKVKNLPIDELRSVLKKSSLILTEKRYDVAWGAAEQSLAEMALYRSAFTSGSRYEYYHLLSGCCLPIKSQHAIHHFFAAKEHRGKNFLFVHPRASQWDYERFSRYHFKSRNTLVRWLNRLQARLGIDRIRGQFPVFRRGHNWCSLTHQAVLCLLKHEKAIRRLVRFTRNSDEGYKQLILLNEPGVKDSIHYDEGGQTPDLWYTDWSAGGTHPRTLEDEDFTMLSSIPQLFARKFSEEHMALALRIHNMTTTNALSA